MAKPRQTSQVTVVEDQEDNSVGIRHDIGRELTPELQAEFRAISAANNGLIHAEAVVNRAENPLNPLHKFFEWDNDKAGDQWRLMQARYLIRSFKVEIEPLKVIPAFVSLGNNRQNGGGYSWTAEVLPRQDLKRNLVFTVLSDVENIARKVQDVPELQPLFEVLTAIRTHMAENIIE